MSSNWRTFLKELSLGDYALQKELLFQLCRFFKLRLVLRCRLLHRIKLLEQLEQQLYQFSSIRLQSLLVATNIQAPHKISQWRVKSLADDSLLPVKSFYFYYFYIPGTVRPSKGRYQRTADVLGVCHCQKRDLLSQNKFELRAREIRTSLPIASDLLPGCVGLTSVFK